MAPPTMSANFPEIAPPVMPSTSLPASVVYPPGTGGPSGVTKLAPCAIAAETPAAPMILSTSLGSLTFPAATWTPRLRTALPSAAAAKAFPARAVPASMDAPICGPTNGINRAATGSIGLTTSLKNPPALELVRVDSVGDPSGFAAQEK